MTFMTKLPSDYQERLTFTKSPNIDPSAIIYKSNIGEWTEIGEKTILAESVLDDFSYIASSYSNIFYTQIGKFCSIASHVRINPGNHPMERVTQHHCTYRKKQFGFAEHDDENFFNWRRDHHCFVGHDVWIGHSAIIMPGVEIGIGAVIGAGSVITKNVEPYSIVVGVPGKEIRKRFLPHQIEKLLRIQWWNWDYDTIKNSLNDLHDINLFLEKYS